MMSLSPPSGVPSDLREIYRLAGRPVRETVLARLRPLLDYRFDPKLVGALLLFVGIALLQLASHNDVDGILFLLILPISFVAAAFGLAGGSIAAGASLLLVAVWDGVSDVGLGPLGYLVRAVLFFAAAVAIVRLNQARSPVEDHSTDLPLAAPSEIVGSLTGDRLSPREREVLELVARGATNAQIAVHFTVSEETVKSHVKHILKKLGVGNRTAAARRFAEARGHLPPSGPPEVAMPASTPEPVRPDRWSWGATNSLTATVVGLSSSDRVALRLEDGREIEVPVLEEIRGAIDAGREVLVYFDERGALISWYLPHAGLGVDMREWLNPEAG